MMTLRAGRRAFYLGFVALCGIGGSALPAAAQNYLGDNGNNVTVDYSVIGLGSGPGTVARGSLPGQALPAGSCSCGNAPMGVVAAPPRPTFTNPFGTQVTQAPAVPPGFLAYSQIGGQTASGSNGSAVVLREPSAPAQVATAEQAPVEETPAAPMPTTTPTQAESNLAPAEPALPATTKTQTQPSTSGEQAAAPSGEATAPAPAESMPTEVPSPVQPPAEQAPAAEAPAEQAPAAEAPAQPPAEPQTAEAPPATPPASSAATSAEPQPESQPQGEQQAAVAPAAPAAPAEGATPPAGAAALPAGATRLLYTGESDEVPADSTGKLDAIAQDLLANQDKRIQVLSYAAGTEDTESKARRKSLARGLAIRSYLMKAGVPSTRIDVRALGNKAEGGPADRVDIIPAS